MNKRGRLQPTATDDGPSAAKGYEPDPGFERVPIMQPKLDCSDVGLDDDTELWLLQLPHDFPTGTSVRWELSEDAADGFCGRCKVKGVEYVLVPEAEALSADLYATPATEHGSLVPVTWRMTVAHTTVAPMVCFGQQDMEVAGVPSVAELPSPDKRALKKKKEEMQQRVPADPAQAVSEPRGSTAPAARSKVGQEVPGAGDPPGATLASQQQGELQQQEWDKRKQKKDKSAKKAKKREQEAAVAAAAGGSKSSSKKPKKRTTAAVEQQQEGVAAAAAATTTPTADAEAAAAEGKPSKKQDKVPKKEKLAKKVKMAGA